MRPYYPIRRLAGTAWACSNRSALRAEDRGPAALIACSARPPPSPPHLDARDLQGGALLPARGLESPAGRLPVVGDERGVLAEPGRSELLESGGHLSVEPSSSLAELRPVRHVAHQRMLERVFRSGDARDQAQEPLVLELGENRPELALVEAADLSEERLVELPADDRGRLQEVLRRLTEPIHARAQQRLHRRGQGEGVDGRCQPIGAALAGEASRRRQRVDELLGEERIASGALANALREVADRRVRSEEVEEEFAAGRFAERRERELVVLGSSDPRRPVLRSKVCEEQSPGVAHGSRDLRQELVAR